MCNTHRSPFLKMKLEIAIDYSVPSQQERIALVEIKQSLVEAIVRDHFNQMDYRERQTWLMKNNVKAISTDLV